MKMRPIFLNTACLWLIQLFLSSSAISENTLPEVKGVPSNEKAILRTPKDPRGWKKITDIYKEDYTETGLIPANQDPKTFTEFLGMYTFVSGDANKRSTTIEKFSLRAHLTALELYPGKKITWNVIRTGKYDLVYEIITHSPDKGEPHQQLSRIFLTNPGFIRVCFLRTDRQMSQEERQKWIEILEGVELVDAGPLIEMDQIKPDSDHTATSIGCKRENV